MRTLGILLILVALAASLPGHLLHTLIAWLSQVASLLR
jgi:hypothetical protein